jgi:hypothetical protein
MRRKVWRFWPVFEDIITINLEDVDRIELSQSKFP